MSWNWNPSNEGCNTFPSGNFINRGAPASSGLDVFCSGHAGLADGRLLIAGGTHPRFGAYGENQARTFSRGAGAITGSWSNAYWMHDWRWYPSATTLRDGRVLVTSGAKYRHVRFYGGRRGGLSPSSPSGDSLSRFAPVQDGKWDKSVLPEPLPTGGPIPPAREGHTFVQTAHVPGFFFWQILFGGKDSIGGPLQDTWGLEREGNVLGDEHRYRWRDIQTATRPPHRSEHTAIAADNEMVIFGGLKSDGTAHDDVWSLSWSQNQFQWSGLTVSGNGPGARYGHAAVYDQTMPGIKRMVVFGGAAAQGQTPTDGKVWQLRLDSPSPGMATWDSVPQVNFGTSPPRPAPRYWHRMAMMLDNNMAPRIRPYPPDPSKTASAAFMFGGALGGGAYSDTVWVLWLLSDGTASWERRINAGTPPAARARHTLTTELPYRNDLIHVFGGENGSGPCDDSVHVVEPYTASVWERWAGRGAPVTGHTGVIEKDGHNARVPDLYDPVTNQWQEMVNAGLGQPTYPPTFVVPGGGSAGARAITFANEGGAYRLDIPSTGPFGSWQAITSGLQELLPVAGVSYRPGRLMIAGGLSFATGLSSGITRRVDAGNLAAGLQTSESMVARMRHNLVLLPTGQVLVVGGVAGTSTGDVNGVFRPQIWYPDSNGVGVWSDVVTPATRLASQPRLRNYHSTAILLPDGRVLSAGGENPSPHKYLFDLFCPPYLFKDDGQLAARPVIDNAPASLSWRDSFTICVPDTLGIEKVCLIRPGATTHSFDQNQLYVPLDFKCASNPQRLLVTTPSTPDSAPPGYYMLFLVGSPEGREVPSVAKWLRLGPEGRDTCDTVKPQVMSPYIESVTTSSMKVTFTHCADDGLIGRSGRPKSYDLRRKTTAISSESAWNTATQLSGEPLPAAVGDTASCTASGLASCTWYHFALRALDDNTNLSNIHGTVMAKTLGAGCSGGGSVMAPDGSDRMGATPPLASARAAANRSTSVTSVPTGSQLGHLVIRTRETAGGGWRVLVTRESHPRDLEPGDAGAVLFQDSRGASFSTRARMILEPSEDRVGLCALRDRGRIVLPEGYALMQFAHAVERGTHGLSLVEARHTALGSLVEQAEVETIPVLVGDSLTLDYEPGATTSGDKESWFLVVGPHADSPGMDRPTTERASSTPLRFALHSGRPNPFRGTTTVAFDLPASQRVRILVFDLQGRVIRTLLDRVQPPGSHAVEWNGRNDAGHKVGAGTYLCRMETEGFRAQSKLTALP